MKKILKTLLIGLIVLFILIQFYPRAPQNREDYINNNDIIQLLKPKPAVESTLRAACYDCHSNNTSYPWYSKIQPVSMWLNDHIIDGKKHLNFSIFGSYPLARKFHKFEEIIEMVKENEMPLKSYTLIHTEAKLDSLEKQLLIMWASQQMEHMKELYPADSLIQKKK